MALQFVFGGSGAGKTRYLYEEVIRVSLAEPGKKVLVVVPEQFTMQVQKELIALHPQKGIMDIDVLSFKRLAYRVFDELGVTLPAVLDDMGKSMVLRRVCARMQGGLELYGGHLGQAGFISQLKSQISELRQYGIEPDALREIRGEAGELLSAKLKDLGTIYQEFQDYIENHYITAEDILDILCKRLPESKFLDGSVIYLDGYTGFTPVQHRLVELFLEKAQKVVCALTIDPKADPYKESGIQNLFYMSKHAVSRLASVCREKKIPILDAVILEKRPGPRYENSPSLGFLEQELYRYGRNFWEGTPGEVELFAGQTPADEIRYVKSRMQELTRSGKLRYRDMAVVTGDLENYGREIARQFDKAQIPWFMDNKKSILENPMVELIRAVTEAMGDFSYENVFRYLKTGLVYDLENEEARYSLGEAKLLTSRLENYVRALGIVGWKSWEREWERVPKGFETLNLAELNAFREWVLTPLKKLRVAFSQKGATIAQVTEALREFLVELRIEEKLTVMSENFSAQGDEAMAREYAQVYGLVDELLEQLSGLLGEETAQRKVYAQILEAGFSEIRVGVLPATLDQVLVGDLTRTRLEGIQVLFFVGVNDGIVPQKKSGGSLLTDRDREFFKARRMELAPTAREDGCMQKFYLYRMLTKPSARLVLTYAGQDAAGKALRPSTLLTEVRRLFPDLKEIRGEHYAWPLQTRQDAKEALIGGLSACRHDQENGKEAIVEEFLELYRWFLRQDEESEQARALVRAACYYYEEKGIGKAAARALYGDVLQGSVTRLEQYASCAYAHFLRYGLELLERREYELEAVDLGNLFHQSIDRCFETMKEQGRDWRALTEESRKELVKECVGKVVEEYGSSIMTSNARYAYLAGRVERMTDRTIWALAEQVKRGDFTPVGFEVSFSASDNLKAMRIGLDDGAQLRLKGRIDRMDLCEDEEKLYVKIIDYKSGGTRFDLSALYYGLQLQLVVYLDAAMELVGRSNPGKKLEPAGIFYYNIQDPLVEKTGEMSEDEIQGEILKKLKMNGLVNSKMEVISHLDRDIKTQSDVIPVAIKAGLIQESRSSVASAERFDLLRGYVNRKLRAAGNEILSGEARMAPYKETNRTSCDYCPYHAVCGFDTKTAGYAYRRLKSLDTDKIWEELEKQGGNDDGSDMDKPANESH